MNFNPHIPQKPHKKPSPISPPLLKAWKINLIYTVYYRLSINTINSDL